MIFSRLIMTALVLVPAVVRSEELQHELLVFGSGELIDIFHGEPETNQVNENKLTADILFSVQYSSLRLFGEFLLSNQEADLERFQLGWQATEDTVAWLGRFHQPGSSWNHDHHHGQFLQTSITRPVVDNWEDDDGIIPQHFTGVLVESNWHLTKTSAIRTAIGAGIAPSITAEGLEPYDLLKPDSGHQLGVQGRIAFLPDEFGDTEFGVSVAHSELNAHVEPAGKLSGLRHVDQTVFGFYATDSGPLCKLTGAAYYVTAELKGTQNDFPEDHFLVGYLQAEKNLPHQMLLFARHENSSRARQAAYMSLIPQFVVRRTLAGLRWDFTSRQAVTLQVSDSHTSSIDYRDIRIQWSAALL